jgi:CspA family cold shock protein
MNESAARAGPGRVPDRVVGHRLSRSSADNPPGTATWVDAHGADQRKDLIRKRSVAETCWLRGVVMIDTGEMANTGTVREWDTDEGWGVIDSVDTPGGCWAHFSSISGMTGYLSLTAGQQVSFTFEQAREDGYGFRAVDVRPTEN